MNQRLQWEFCGSGFKWICQSEVLPCAGDKLFSLSPTFHPAAVSFRGAQKMARVMKSPDRHFDSYTFLSICVTRGNSWRAIWRDKCHNLFGMLYIVCGDGI
jgi:hypothetical protein